MTQNESTKSNKAIPDNRQQVALAKQAAAGESAARAEVNRLAHPIISFQTQRFCKRFCRENKYRFICTLVEPQRTPSRDAVLCEWGNASYTWMLDELVGPARLRQFSGKNGAHLKDYIYHIANSLPFYERWKDWRFGRRVHVPTYIKELSPEAGRIFFGLRAGESIPNIAQNLGCSEQRVEQTCQQIVIILTQRKRLHLLDPPVTVSLTVSAGEHPSDAERDGSQMDIPSFDELPESLDSKHRLARAWRQLAPEEQYVIEAMVLDEQDATHVLQALQALDISIKPGVAPAKTNRQQLYYFRRKTLARLAELMEQA